MQLDYEFNRLIRLEKGTRPASIWKNQQQHLKSQREEFSVTPNDENSWAIVNIKEGELINIKWAGLKSFFCENKCEKCKICYHFYTCSCSEYAVSTIICQHIHYIKQNYPLLIGEGAEQPLVIDEELLSTSEEKRFLQETVLKKRKEEKNDLPNQKLKLIKAFTASINFCSTVEELSILKKNHKLVQASLHAIRKRSGHRMSISRNKGKLKNMIKQVSFKRIQKMNSSQNTTQNACQYADKADSPIIERTIIEKVIEESQ